MAHRSDTIVALSSAPGRAGVAVIRISGPDALSAAAALAGDLPAPRRASLRTLREPQGGEILDQAIVLVFPAPSSFTGEDIVELHVHGSIAVQRAVLGALTAQGRARLAAPGEFTRRAWLNDRMTLLDVEALGDLLAAETESQRRLAQRSRRDVASRISGWREQLLHLRAVTEAAIDFTDEADVVERLDSDSERSIRRLMNEMEAALASFRVAERIRLGMRVAILGPPNAGKSSLLNALARRDVAITSPIPGTTRDSIEAHIDLEGHAICFVDTAGIRESADAIETAGVARSWQNAEAADLTLWLSPVDAPVPSPDVRFVTVTSKSDLGAPANGEMSISVIDPDGLKPLIALLKEKATSELLAGDHDVFLSSERQLSAARSAHAGLSRALHLPADDVELRAEELRLSIEALDGLVGRIAVEDVLGEIFSRFCIGK